MLFCFANYSFLIKAYRKLFGSLKVFNTQAKISHAIPPPVFKQKTAVIPPEFKRIFAINESTPQKQTNYASNEALADSMAGFTDDIEIPWQQESNDLANVSQQTISHSSYPSGNLLSKGIIQQCYYLDIKHFMIRKLNIEDLIVMNDH